MAKHKEENPLFVGVTSGDEVRRSILECSKGILEALKEYERVKSVRAEKVKLINQFRNDVRGISRSITSLRMRLPKVKEIEVKKPEVKKVKKEGPKIVKVEKPRVKTEMEKLEEELSDIEGKLRSLG